MQVSPPGSGIQFRKSIFNQDQHIPNCDPCDPIFPESSGRSLPTPPTEKFLLTNLPPPKTHEYTYVKEPTIPKEYEHVKKAAIPAEVIDRNPLSKEVERLRFENSRLKDDKLVLIREYEERLKNLQRQGDSSKQAEEERARLIEEINRLRLRNATLEAQLEDNKGNFKERDELYKVIEGLRYRVKELETSGLRTSQLTEYERKTIDSQKSKIIDYENKIVLFMIEIERLGKIIAEIQLENDQLALNSSQKDFRDKLQAFESEKTLLRNQIREYSIRIEEYESRISLLKLDLEKQKGNSTSLMQLVLLGAEIERLHLELSAKTQEINQLREGSSNDPITIYRIKADYEESMKTLLSENGRIKADYEEGIRTLLTENASLTEKYRNAALSQQMNLSKTDNSKLISVIKELEAEHRALGDKYHRILTELEQERRNQTITPAHNNQSLPQ